MYEDKRRADRFLVFHYDRLTDIDNILWRARESCGGRRLQEVFMAV